MELYFISMVLKIIVIQDQRLNPHKQSENYFLFNNQPSSNLTIAYGYSRNPCDE